MATLDPTFSRSVSGHVKLRRGKLRSTWYAKWRDPEGVQRERKLGLLWEQKGAAPIGYIACQKFRTCPLWPAATGP